MTDKTSAELEYLGSLVASLERRVGKLERPAGTISLPFDVPWIAARGRALAYAQAPAKVLVRTLVVEAAEGVRITHLELGRTSFAYGEGPHHVELFRPEGTLWELAAVLHPGSVARLELENQSSSQRRPCAVLLCTDFESR